MKKKAKRTLVIVLVAAALGAGLFFGIRAILEATAVRVTVYNVGDVRGFGGYTEAKTYEGTVNGDVIQEVYLDDTDIVKEVNVEQGDEVEKGQILMTYDPTEAAAELEEEKISQEEIELRLKVANMNIETLSKITPIPDIEWDDPDDPDYPRKPTVTGRPTVTGGAWNPTVTGGAWSPTVTGSPWSPTVTGTPGGPTGGANPTVTPTPIPVDPVTPDETNDGRGRNLECICATARLDVFSEAYNEDCDGYDFSGKPLGTADRPYRFLVTHGTVITSGFMEKMRDFAAGSSLYFLLEIREGNRASGESLMNWLLDAKYISRHLTGWEAIVIYDTMPRIAVTAPTVSPNTPTPPPTSAPVMTSTPTPTVPPVTRIPTATPTPTRKPVTPGATRTPTPTRKPTATPTPVPTRTPTPTQAPTNTPVPTYTPVPTATPTSAPFTEPTTAPPADPTAAPPQNPTAAPTPGEVTGVPELPAGSTFKKTASASKTAFAGTAIITGRVLKLNTADFTGGALVEAMDFEEDIEYQITGYSGLIRSDAEYTVSELKEALSAEEENLKNLELDLKEAKIRVERAQRAVDEGVVRAKFDGVIRSLNLEDPTGTMLTLVPVSGLYIQTKIPEDMLDEVTEGTTVYVDGYEGRIRDISLFAVEQSPYIWGGSDRQLVNYYPVTVEVSDASASFQSGDYVTVSLNRESSAAGEAMTLVKGFVREDNDGSYVFARGAGDKLVKRYIVVKSTDPYDYEIIDGLTENDWIAFAYSRDAKEGAPVVEGSAQDLYK